ncbi:MAG TPA: 4-hydroxy-3-methylbut-2-enyl diphosphate reductase [Micromonosporaceae bacterium]
MNQPWVLCAPMRIEAAALRRGLDATPDALRHTGVGARRARLTAERLDLSGYAAIAVAGVAGGLRAPLRAGDVVVADRVRTVDGSISVDCPAAALVATALRRRGLTVHVGPVVSADHLVRGAFRQRLAATGALAADTESAWLLSGAAAASAGALACVRVVADAPPGAVFQPATLGRLGTALRVLPQVASALAEFAGATTVRRVVLAAPRSFCAGVERAVAVVEQALARFGPPVYVRKQIVHNAHVVDELADRGAIFVDDLGEVPPGAITVFSAHGVAPAVRDQAADRGLSVIDATCPLVTKVHAEARRFASRGDTVLFIGHAGHEETEGTMGEAPSRVRLVETREDAERVEVDDPDRVSYLVQTTLAVDEVAGIVDTLRSRFPALAEPPSDDICYATTNRQHALRAIAAESDLVLVLGSVNSSNSRRLVEVAARAGTVAHLVDDVHAIDPRWLAGARTVGVTAGASAPPALVDDVVAALRGLGAGEVVERAATVEDVHFTLPKEVRQS